MSCKMFDPGVVPRSDLLLCGKGWMEDMAQLQLAGQGRAEEGRGCADVVGFCVTRVYSRLSWKKHE